jgi:sulfur carrier protein
MAERLEIQVNGQPRSVEGVAAPVTLDRVIEALGLRGDRIAVEHKGVIAPRTGWAGVLVVDGDQLEIVHFVGGGSVQGLG